MTDRSFDVIVLGAGPAGEVCAGRLAEAGLSVAIVETELVGGECSYWACMPSKALLRPEQALGEARRVPGAAQGATGTLDATAVLARRDEVVHDFDDAAQLPFLEDLGIELVRGHGRLDGERRVVVGDDALTAERAVVVATGSAARRPPIDGLDTVRPWTNREATESKHVPERLLVLGGGPVGVELAQAWRSLGSEVTLVEGGERVLGHEEPFASEEVEQALRGMGVDVRTATKATAAERAGDEVRLTLDSGDTVAGDELLLALGRTPRTSDIGLDTVGLEDGAFIDTDEHLRAGGRDWLYALGDANGRALLTHMGKEQARIIADRITGRPNTGLALDGARSPRVTFTEPQVAAVGHTLAGRPRGGAQRPRGRQRRQRDRRRQLLRPRRARQGPARRRRGPPGRRRRDVHGRRRQRPAALGDDRRRGRGPDRPPLARGPVVSDAQRGLAQAAGGLRPVRAPWPEKPPPGPFRPTFWKSPLRGPWLTAFLGSLLLAMMIVVGLTGFLSHIAYQPDLGRTRSSRATATCCRSSAGRPRRPGCTPSTRACTSRSASSPCRCCWRSCGRSSPGCSPGPRSTRPHRASSARRSRCSSARRSSSSPPASSTRRTTTPSRSTSWWRTTTPPGSSSGRWPSTSG
jgi:dihydrolipoamide dehydrogenase